MASILNADGQKQIRRLVSKALISDGYHVTTMDDACGAGEQIDECRPDMMLLNCLSEDFDSYELLIDIKRRHPDYPVLVYTVINHETIDDLKETISGWLNETRPKDLNKKSQQGLYRQVNQDDIGGMNRNGNGPERSAFRSAFFTFDFSILSIFALSIVMSIDHSAPLLATIRSGPDTHQVVRRDRHHARAEEKIGTGWKACVIPGVNDLLVAALGPI